MSSEEQFVWQDLPTLEQLEISLRMEYHDAWLHIMQQCLADAVKKNTEPAMFKAHYNVLVSSITLVISGDVESIQQQSKRFKKLCKNLHQAYKPNSIAIIDSYTRAAAKFHKDVNRCGKLICLLEHPTVGFCDPGSLIEACVFDDENSPSWSVDHPDSQHWYMNANFIEVADMLAGHNT